MFARKKNEKIFIYKTGVNHNNKIKLAYRLIDAAKTFAGADAINFKFLKQKIMSLRKHLSLIIKKKILNKLISIDL